MRLSKPCLSSFFFENMPIFILVLVYANSLDKLIENKKKEWKGYLLTFCIVSSAHCIGFPWKLYSEWGLNDAFLPSTPNQPYSKGTTICVFLSLSIPFIFYPLLQHFTFLLFSSYFLWIHQHVFSLLLFFFSLSLKIM